MANNIFLRALGLSTSPNRLANEPGSLIEATNVVIKRDSVIEPRRGFKLYGDSFGSISDRAKQLFTYKSRILRHYNSSLQFDTKTVTANGESIFQTFSGTFNEPETGIRIKSLEAPNGNFYFTTDDGIKKISASNASELTSNSNYITDAGGLKALNTAVRLNIQDNIISSWFTQDSGVAYRILWNIKDANSNLIQGTPSERVEIFNPMLQLMLNDYAKLLSALDNVGYEAGSIINDKNYVDSLLLPNSAAGASLRTNLIALCEKLDLEQGTLFSTSNITGVTITAGIAEITFNTNIGLLGKVAIGDKLFLKNFQFSGGDGTINGAQTITDVDIGSNTISFLTTSTLTGFTTGTESIEAGWFRSIEEPDTLSSTPTHAELQEVQDYLEAIITELQSARNLRQIIDNDGINTIFPAELVSVVGTLGVATVTTEATADLRNIASNGDLIFLKGTFSGTSSSINGVQTINGTAITATAFEFNTAATGTAGLAADSQIYRILRFTDDTQIKFIDDLGITSSATTFVTIQIPEEATLDHFYQIYRSDLTTAIGTDVLSDLAINDEMKLVYSDYVSQEQLDAGEITVEDIVLDDFRGANLYTNAITGEGILQANDLPPLAKDINIYKNYTFFANTKTLQRFNLDLLGVVDLISEYNNGRTPKLVVSGVNGAESDVYEFIVGSNQITPITFNNNESGGNYTATYFLLSSANDFNNYYIWYRTDGAGTDPDITDRIGVVVDILSGDTKNTIALKTQNTLSALIRDFSVGVVTDTITITNIDNGYTTNAINGTVPVPGLSIGSITSGIGAKAEQETTTLTCVADISGSLNSTYFTLSTAFDRQSYYVWYNVNGAGSDPSLSGKIGIPVALNTNDSATVVAEKTVIALNLLDDGIRFIANSDTTTLVIKNYRFGLATSLGVGTTGFTIDSTVKGALQVLLATSTSPDPNDILSPALSVDLTARSLIQITNKNYTGLVSGFYLSGAESVPGKMIFEAKDLSQDKIFFSVNKAQGAGALEVGDSFEPILTPTNLITSISINNPTVITSTAHGLSDNDQILISNSNSTPNIDGVYTITRSVGDPLNQFTIPVNVTASGTTGGWIYLDNVNINSSDNEESPNRLYYSKFQQPEAVPILNYLDLGPKDKAILRIYPLRDSLMVFKEDGLYRVSGEVAPFSVSVFDNSAILAAPDSLSISNGALYSWNTQGISSTTESGVTILSRPIDVDILYRSSSQFTNFRTATWGVGYESDNSYLVFTIEETNDTIAQVAYVYNNLTSTWTTYKKTNTCGIVNSADDKLYLGAGDINQIEIERKLFNRTDYADREYEKLLVPIGYLNDGLQLKVNSPSNISVGDVLTQEQILTIYEYNALLKKLDIDTSVSDNNYFTTLEAAGGVDLRDKIADSSPTIGLAAKLDADSGVTDNNYLDAISSKTGNISSASINNTTTITTTSNHELVSGRIVSITGNNAVPSINGTHVVTVLNATTFTIPVKVVTAGTATGSFATVDDDFRDIGACYNEIIRKLNLDSGVSFSNYKTINTTTLQETIIEGVNVATNQVTVKTKLPFIVGNLTIYKAINSTLTYTPITFNDPLSLKHIREATMMFQDRLFTNAKLSFSTDLLPAFTDIVIPGSNGAIFGHKSFGEGFFGGQGNAAPFRTYIPRNAQRCRFLNIKFTHQTAREKYSINGVSLVGEVSVSTRAYR